MMTKTYIPIWELPMSSTGAELFTGGTGVTMSYDGGAGEILMDADASNTPYGELALPDGDPAVGKRLAVEAMLGVSGSGAPAILKVMQNDGTSDIELGQTTVTLSESVTLDVTCVSNNQPFVVVMQGDVGAEVRIPLLGYKEIDDVVHDVVMMECNDDEFGTDYRFGFNGMTKDNNLKGIGNSLDFGARIQDSRLGRWLSIDPLAKKYPYASPYNFGLNSPLYLKDGDGREVYIYYVTPTWSPDEWFGHNSLGVKMVNDENATYFPASGHMTTSEWDAINYYTDNGRTVIKLVIDLPKPVEKELKDLLTEWNEWDPSSALICTGQIKEALAIVLESMKNENGTPYSKEQIDNFIQKILPNSLPSGTPTDVDDAKEAGYKRVEKFEKDDEGSLIHTIEVLKEEPAQQKSTTTQEE